MKELFEVIAISRDDIEEGLGFDSSNISDETMEKIADAMADMYLDDGFWSDLAFILEKFEIPKLNDKNN